MKTRYRQNGFTLIEILVAAAIIVSILSFVYGTYFITSKSTKNAKAKLILFQKGQKVLLQLTRQIRCSYANTVSDAAYTTKSGSEQKEKMFQNNPDFFSYRTNNPHEEILHLITTNKFDIEQNLPGGLFDVTYKFNKSKGVLYLSQEIFVGTAKNSIEKRSWLPIAENIKSLKFAFFDGLKWLDNWSFKDRKKLPNAVKIDITFESETSQTYRYGTVAYICCHNNYGQETQFDKLVIAKK